MNLLGQSLVYFVSAVGANAIKIGFTTDLAARLKELETGSPFELLPVAAIFGPATLEFTAHWQLKTHRIRGEWFDDCREVWSYIETHAHYILGRNDNEQPFVRLRRSHEAIYREDDSPHRGLLVGNIREAFNASPLDGRQRQILSMRFGLDPAVPAMTLVQIGEVLGITHERVRQIEKRSLETLRRNRELLDLSR